MIIVTHIAIALLSILWATYLYAAPTKNKMYTVFGLIGGTLASGIVLVVSTGSPILKSCITGVAYLAIVLTMTLLAGRKLARQEQ